MSEKDLFQIAGKYESIQDFLFSLGYSADHVTDCFVREHMRIPYARIAVYMSIFDFLNSYPSEELNAYFSQL